MLCYNVQNCDIPYSMRKEFNVSISPIHAQIFPSNSNVTDDGRVYTLVLLPRGTEKRVKTREE